MTSRPRLAGHFLLSALFVLAACKGTEPPRPTTIQISAQGGAVPTLASIGATVQLRARVLDQNGDSMPGQAATWSSSDQLVVTVSAGGLVTAVANGTARITAALGAASGFVDVTVAQAVAAMQKQAGDLQSGTVGQPLLNQISVRALDALGAPVAGATVSWAVTGGGGSVSGGNADGNGIALAAWTLGTTAGAGVVTATSNAVVASFGATQVAGPASGISTVAGNNQTAAVNTAVPVNPRVRVVDQYGNAKSSVAVAWTVTGGGGSTSSGTTNTGSSGETEVIWTMGSGGGANSLTAGISGGANVVFAATALVAGAPTSMVAYSGDNQAALAGFPTNRRPAVRVTDAATLPVANVSVTFTPQAGGSVSGGTAMTNVDGIAQVGSWTPGATAGSYSLTASASGLSDVVIVATAQNAAYNIEIRNIGPPLSPAVQAAFDAAEALWEQIIYGEQLDIPISTTDACLLGVTIQETVDDIIILAQFDSIDGPGQILGQAGACSRRTINGLPIYGAMLFDTADVAGLISSGRLDAVILHEMGHVLGFSVGTWNTQAGFTQQRLCAQNVSAPGLDSYFHCLQAGALNRTRAMFDSIGGTSYTGGNKVPLENCVAGVPPTCGPGTLYSHWREATFGNELMTGYLNSGTANPLSVLTITSFEDSGYLVNYAAAQAYTRTFTAPAAASGTLIDLGDDALRVPIEVVDASGRVVRVIRP